MQIRDRIRCGRRLWRRVAAARFVIDRRSGTVVGAHPGEPGDLGKHRQRRFVGCAPIRGGRSQAADQHDGGRSGAAALEIDPATPADIDEAREVRVFQSTGGVRVQHGEEWGKKQGKASAEGHRDANG